MAMTVDLTETPKEMLCFTLNTTPNYLVVVNDNSLTKSSVYYLLKDIFTENEMNFDSFYAELNKNADKTIDIDIALQIWFYIYKKRGILF